VPVISQKQKLAEDVYVIKVKAPELAKRAQPGHYVTIQISADSPKYSLLITNAEKTMVSFVVQASGQYGELTKLKKGDALHSFCGPLGKSLAINELGNVIIIAEHAGLGPAFFFGKAFKQAGNRVYFISRYPHKKSRFWEKKLSKSFDKWFLLTKKKEINDSILKELNNLLRKKHVKLTLALCNLDLMPAIVHSTKLRSALYCSLLPMVTDGPATCPDCRVGMAGSTKLPCIDGPIFNGHRIEWKEVIAKFNQRNPKEVLVEQ